MTMLPRFALNHMTAPRFEVGEFFRLARSLGLSEVEIRNDLAGNAILDGTAAATVRALADQAGVTIISINALQRFNEWTAEREREAIELADYAEACGAKALVLVPVNDGSGRANGERQGNLRVALKALQDHPVVARHHRTGRAARLRDLLAALQAGSGRRHPRGGRRRGLPPGPRHVPPPSRRAAGVVSRDDRRGPHFGRERRGRVGG